jgi:hypothetical protein
MTIKDSILAVDDRPYEDVDVPEWGRTVRIRGFSATEQEEFIVKWGSLEEGEFPKGMQVDLLVRTLHDPDTDAPIFTQSEEDGRALGGKASAIITRLVKRAQPLCGIGDMEEAKND